MYTLIIVDDEQEIRDGLSQFIDWAAIGFECVGTAAGGHEAMQMIEKLRPDVALCDIRMPGMTGLDIARRLYESKSGTLLVLLSAYRDFEYARTAMTYNVRYYIIKSTRYAELVETFQRIRQELDESHLFVQTEDGLTQEICRYVERHLDTASLDAVALHFQRSASGISRHFHQHTGTMFSQYLLRRRMQRAVELLMDGRRKIAAISEQLGYANPQNFARTFRQYFGMTPREYREGQGVITQEPDNEENA